VKLTQGTGRGICRWNNVLILMFFIFYISIVEILTVTKPIFDRELVLDYINQNKETMEPFYAVKIIRIETDAGEITDFTTNFFDDILSFNFLNNFANI
jgi:hypothetical protein